MNTWGREAFACHPHQLYGAMAQAACGENGPGTSYPTGGANTADGWPPLAYVVIANFARPFFIFVEDPLYTVRGAVVLTWSLGMVALACLAITFGIRRIQIVAWIAAVTALPAIGYFSAFVTPYSLLPLLVACLLWSFKELHRLITQREKKTRREILQSVIAVSLVVLSTLAIPHAIAVVGALALGLTFEFLKSWSATRLKSWRQLLSDALLPPFLALGALVSFSVYRRLNALRSVPYPSDTRPDVGDPLPEREIDLIRDMTSVAWRFFPGGLRSELPVDQALSFLSDLAIFLVVTIIVASALNLLRRNQFGSLSLGVLIASPLAGTFFFYELGFETPLRYGLPLALFAVALSVMVPLRKPALTALFVLSLLLTISALRADPIYIQSQCMEVGPSGFLVPC
jgi:hypothetical protein